jgi:TolB-like protein
MADIFISYSRKDSAHALALAERLRTFGMNVWIDQHGLEVASQWSTEIVKAVEHCEAFLLLLSNESLLSKNVVRELSIASESDRKILPIELEDITLPSEFKYQLAGIQRAKLSDFEGILRSLTKLGLSVSESALAVSAEARNLQKQDTRKSLMVLPFEDLSPGKDNDWFADGLAGELIDALGHIKSLRLVDRKTTMDFKGFRGKTLEIAEELNVRYFIEGTVRKFGDQIKISVSLLDVKEGDYLWQESHKGVFSDIFEIQEAVADKVVAGLKLHLTQDEKQKVVLRGTDSAEAFELNLQATSFLNMGTRQGHLHAIRLYEEAIAIDPNYAVAYLGIANNSMLLYRSYERDASLLVRAEQTIAEAMRLLPNFAGAYSMLGILHAHRHQEEEAIAAAKMAVELEPGNPWGYFHLGFVYNELGRSAESAEAYEATLRIKPDELISNFNLALQYHMLGDLERRMIASTRALTYFEKYVQRHPDDQSKRTFYSILLFFAGRLNDCKRETEAIVALPGLDGFTCYNCGCTFIFLNDLPRALELLEKAVDLGFASRKLFLHDPDLAPLRSLEGWNRILTKLDAAEQKESIDRS